MGRKCTISAKFSQEVLMCVYPLLNQCEKTFTKLKGTEGLAYLETTMNTSICQGHQEESQISQINEILFWTSTAISTLIVVFGILSNSLVLYFSKTKTMAGSLRHLNTVVKHLAVSDLLYGLLACPLMSLYWKTGKSQPELALAYLPC